MAKEFTCAICNKTFDKAWSDEEAQEELEATFGSIPIEECEVVCDVCYNKLGLSVCE